MRIGLSVPLVRRQAQGGNQRLSQERKTVLTLLALFQIHKTMKEVIEIVGNNLEAFYAVLTFCYTGQIR